MTALGSRIDSAKYSAGWCAPMPVSSGPASPAPPRFDPPPPHGIRGGAVEIRVPGRLLDEDVAHAPLAVDEHTQQRRALDAEPARGRRIRRRDLIAAARNRRSGQRAWWCGRR